VFKWLRPKNPKKVLKQALRDYSLPSFPGTVTQVLERIRDDSSSAADVAEALSSDPGLSVRVLATVNSAAYAPRRKVENLGQAVVILGISNLETLVFAIAVNQALPAPECRGFDARRFWQTSARRAAVARVLAERLHPATRSVSFTAGLLQDMAIPLLARSRADEYGPVLEAWLAGAGSLVELERARLKVDHAEVASWMCLEWGLPEGLTLAITGHHHPIGSFSGCPPAVSLVSLLCEREADGGQGRLIDAVVEKYRLDRDRLTEQLELCFAEAEELARNFA